MGRYGRVSFKPQVSETNDIFWHYYNRLLNIALSLFTWENLPDGIDERYLELSLISHGNVAFGYDPLFKDEINSGFYIVQTTLDGTLDIYNTPSSYRGYTVTSFSPKLTNENSVLCYNNLSRTCDVYDINMYAKRLTNLVETIDTNVLAQKTPVILSGTDKIRLSMVNVLDKIVKNVPFIMVDRKFKLEDIQALKIDAPYVSDKLTTLKRDILSEYFNFLGIDNFYSTKGERSITGEVDSNSVSVQAEGQSRLKARKAACEKFNRLFAEPMGLQPIDVHYSTMARNVNRVINDITEGGGVENVDVHNES